MGDTEAINIILAATRAARLTAQEHETVVAAIQHVAKKLIGEGKDDKPGDTDGARPGDVVPAKETRASKRRRGGKS